MPRAKTMKHCFYVKSNRDDPFWHLALESSAGQVLPLAFCSFYSGGKSWNIVKSGARAPICKRCLKAAKAKGIDLSAGPTVKAKTSTKNTAIVLAAITLGTLAIILVSRLGGNTGQGNAQTANQAVTNTSATAVRSSSSSSASLTFPTLAPSLTPLPSPAPAQTSTVMVVSNTGGDGVFVRRTTDVSKRIKAWPENTQMIVVGENMTIDNTIWINVKDPDGNEGLVSNVYLSVPTPTPSAGGRTAP